MYGLKAITKKILAACPSEPIELIIHFLAKEEITPKKRTMNTEADGTMLKVTYNYQGEFYEVTDSSGIHSKLQADVNFFDEFFQKATGKNIVQDNLGESYCSQINPHHTMPAQEDLNETPNNDENDHTMPAQEDLNETPNNNENDHTMPAQEDLNETPNNNENDHTMPAQEDLNETPNNNENDHTMPAQEDLNETPNNDEKDHTMPAQEDLNETPNNDENDSKFEWDHKSILFLLSKYFERLAKFRNPKIKKITLWREIEKEFDKIGISQVNAQMIDHKFRNLKATYKNIKNNNKKTGRGRQTWEWYQQMAEILENDKSVNFDTGIASIDDGPINLSQRRISSEYRLSSTLMSPFQNFHDIYDFVHFSSHIRSLSSSSDAFSDSDAESSADTPSNSRHLDASDCSCSSMPSEEPTSPGSAQSLTFSITSKESKTGKSTHAKNLYSQRNRALQQESSKIDVLRSIENKYDRVLQQEASKIDVLRSIETAVAHKNELLQRKNEILERRNELLESLIEKRNNTT